MRSLLIACLSLVIAPACIITTGAPVNPDMYLTVTFDGRGCDQASVSAIRVSFVGSDIGSTSVGCISGPIEVGIPSVVPGDYTVRVEAFDSRDLTFVAYSDTFALRHTLGGTHEYALDLLSTTEVVTSFVFASAGQSLPGMTCAQAGVSTLEILVDGTQAYRQVPCTTNGRDAASLSGIAPGVHDIAVEAYDADGRKLYASSFGAVPVMRGANDLILNLLPISTVRGGMALSWDFGGLNCEQAWVSTVSFTLVDATGAVVGSYNAGCQQAPLTFGFDNASSSLTPGLYALSNINGYDVTGGLLYSASNVPLFAPAGRNQAFLVHLQ